MPHTILVVCPLLFVREFVRAFSGMVWHYDSKEGITCLCNGHIITCSKFTCRTFFHCTCVYHLNCDCLVL